MLFASLWNSDILGVELSSTPFLFLPTDATSSYPIKKYTISLSGASYSTSSSKSTYTVSKTWSCPFNRILYIDGSFTCSGKSPRDGCAESIIIAAGTDKSNLSGNKLIILTSSFTTVKDLSWNTPKIIDECNGSGFCIGTKSNDTYTGSGVFSNINISVGVYYF